MMNDDELLAELAAALAESRDVPAGFGASGRQLYTWLTVDAELAELSEDSLRPDPAGAAVRSAQPAGPRSLTFRTPTLTIDLDVEPSALRGQVVVADGQPVPAEVTVEAVVEAVVASPSSTPISAPVDGVGYFEFVPFPFAGRRFRLRCGSVVTPWID